MLHNVVMCLISFGWNAHPKFPLVLAANRDEFHARPTAALAPWDALPDVIGGRDLREGGGWLAVHRERRLAAVTNVRLGTRDGAAPRSRGHLVRDFLRSEESSAGFAQRLQREGPQYGPYNLLLWDGNDLIYAGNQPAPHWQAVSPGVHGISNASLDTPWPKLVRVNQSLQHWLAADPDTGNRNSQDLLAALADDRRAADDELPETGVGLDMERLLSPPFIRSPAYGTRASSVVIVDVMGDISFRERGFDADGRIVSDIELLLPPLRSADGAV